MEVRTRALAWGETDTGLESWAPRGLASEGTLGTPPGLIGRLVNILTCLWPKAHVCLKGSRKGVGLLAA